MLGSRLLLMPCTTGVRVSLQRVSPWKAAAQCRIASVQRSKFWAHPSIARCFASEATNKRDSIRVCVVGSGPAGFFATKYLLKDNTKVHVDMIEALPVPYGLVRAGVAPDHPEVKSVINDFEVVASDPRFGFLGNVTVGQDIEVQELQQHYHAIVFAYGAEGDRTLNIPGEQLQGVLAARTFVNWYNGHPSYQQLNPNLQAGDNAVVIGQGNVAIDCARILLKQVHELAKTDITSQAVKHLENSTIKNVYLVGRRGSVQAAFTMKELRELTKLENVSCVIDPENFQACQTKASTEELGQQRAKQRQHKLLESIVASYEKNSKADKQIRFQFLSNPVEILPDTKDPSRVGAVKFEKTRLEGEPGKQKAVGTGEFETIPCSLVLRSIGYKSKPIRNLPFDPRLSVLPNALGRLVDPSNDNATLTGMYCTGWVKRGPTGIINANIVDARETVSCMLRDFEKGQVLPVSDEAGKDAPLAAVQRIILDRDPTKQLVSWQQVQKLNEVELQRGQQLGKAREKIASVSEMLRLVAQ